jgi:tRNA uridine 5-carboxymethylaminomethyl modification enzyme
MKQVLEKNKLTSSMLESMKAVRGGGLSPINAEQSSSNDLGEGDLQEAGGDGFSRAAISEKAGALTSEASLSSALGQTLAQLLKRPEITIESLAPALRELDPKFFAREEIRANPHDSVASLSSEMRNELKSVETEIKYEGYLLQQQRAIDRLKKAEQRAIPDWFDYHSVSGLSREMQETLLKIRPRTLAHASRIPGVTPAAVSLVHVYIEIQAKRRQQASVL